MQEIKIENKKISYQVKRSRRARYMRLSVSRDMQVTVTMPWSFRQSFAEEFFRDKLDWVLGKLAYFENNQSILPQPQKEDYLKLKNIAWKAAAKKLEYFNSFYGFFWKKISIRNQKTRWGSCSQSGNLNFSYRLVYLPEELRDYIVVHELCHLGEFNHSPKFWKLVARTIPDYKSRRRKIRKM